MGIDRHEWEHRNYKPGRPVSAAPALQPEEEGDAQVHDASLGADTVVPDASADAPKSKGKGAPKAKPAAKRPVRAR